MDRRERRRADAMQRAQDVALDLFEEHGFDAVSVARVARAADLAERTVYRHFGTKEGLVVRDEADAELLSALVAAARTRGAVGGAHAVLTGIPADAWSPDAPVVRTWLRRVRLLMSTPGLRAVLDQETTRLGDALGAAEADGLGADAYASRVRGRAVAAALGVAIDVWYESDGARDLRTLCVQAVDALAPLREDGPVSGRSGASP
ncbi:TetR/AcrR family transcriptional regulator [Cellulosimicrobium arenosum]|uniref:TetR/AcrR family transcriptional regulator n=1 Tax=Cellulosimicrobium arenosum TaxID=2708133 RepID=UPI0019D6B534|nr:TetR/AcrR family transcriptional regulator [Cellulosimicrobium arenosum]